MFKHHTNKLLLIFILLTLFSNKSFSQYTEVDQISLYSSRIDNPIKVTAEENGEKIRFYAENRSAYPYTLIMKFQNIYNLSPYVSSKTYTLRPGSNNLEVFTIRNVGETYNYSYSYSYSLGATKRKIDEYYPYLIPISTHKKIKPYTNHFSNTTYRDSFVMSKGDTLFAMRKGKITATSTMYHNNDRISNDNSLEIMHKDGTIMVIQNLPEKSLIVPRLKKVYPGQPIAILSLDADIIVSLYRFAPGNKLKSISIFYHAGKDRRIMYTKDLTTSKVIHSKNIITKEMSRRERRKYKKGKLY